MEIDEGSGIEGERRGEAKGRGVTIVHLYIIALGGVWRGIDVTNGQMIQCIRNRDGGDLHGKQQKRFDVERWI